MRKIVLAVLIVGSSCLMSKIKAQTPLTPEKLWELGRVGAPALSAAGDDVFYTVKKYDLTKNAGQAQIYRSDYKGKKDRGNYKC